mmetsp:Transcript_2063/g.5432  ORF Transcript_2063/g.5432 Transcript_2063/m.5432 type:complete len:201 (-) Transcript_2063:883-1485(-)
MVATAVGALRSQPAAFAGDVRTTSVRGTACGARRAVSRSIPCTLHRRRHRRQQRCVLGGQHVHSKRVGSILQRGVAKRQHARRAAGPALPSRRRGRGVAPRLPRRPPHRADRAAICAGHVGAAAGAAVKRAGQPARRDGGRAAGDGAACATQLEHVRPRALLPHIVPDAQRLAHRRAATGGPATGRARRRRRRDAACGGR